MFDGRRKTSLRSVGVQTSPIKIFNDRTLLNNCDNFFIQSQKVGPLTKNIIAAHGIEDFILDNIVKRGEAVYGYNVLNAWLKPWESTKDGFSLVNGKLHCWISKFYALIVKKCESDVSLSYHMSCLDNALVDVTKNSYYYFNKLGKLRCRDAFSMAQVFALFMSWASKFLNNMISGYICDFLTLLYLCINDRYDTEEVNLYFINKYLKSRDFPEVYEAVDLYKKWANWEIFFFSEPNDLVSLFTDYFKAVNFERDF